MGRGTVSFEPIFGAAFVCLSLGKNVFKLRPGRENNPGFTGLGLFPAVVSCLRGPTVDE